jgi:uncharacterized protein
MTRILLLVFAALAFGEDLPKPAGLVNDIAGKLTPAERQALESKLRAYEQATSNEVAVAIVPSLRGQTVEEYANRLFKSWGIGKKERNNGVLLLWAPAERKVRIEVGLGLEQAIPNDAAAAILKGVTAAFRREDYIGGLQAGVDGIIARLNATGTEAASPDPAPENPPVRRSGGTRLLIPAIATVMLVTAIVMLWRRARNSRLTTELPKDLKRAGEAMIEAEGIRKDADAAQAELRREAPRELWEEFEPVLAQAPETLAGLYLELGRIKSLPQDGLSELSGVERALKAWNGRFSRLWYELIAVRDQRDRFRSCRDSATALMTGLQQSLDRARFGPASAARLVEAAGSTFTRALAVAALNPVNWLLVYDLLLDTQDCLDCADNPARYHRRTRFWAASEFDSPGLVLLQAQMAMASSSSASDFSSPSAGGGDVGGSSFSSGGDSGSGFGGGDCGGGGASSDY